MTDTIYLNVPPLFEGKTVAVVGSGFSLKKGDIFYLRKHKIPIIAVNNVYEWVPDAEILYACDRKWWHFYRDKGVLGGSGNKHFEGLKISLEDTGFSDVQRVRNTGPYGFDPSKNSVKNGRNSAVQAAHIAIHAGAKTLTLLGCDCRAENGKGSHFFGEHPWRKHKAPSPFDLFLEGWRQFVDAAPNDVTFVNCTPESAIDCINKESLYELNL